MFKNIISIVLILFIVKAKSQDTIYSYPYPNGIITTEINKTITGYKIHPIDNPELEIILRKNEIKNINYSKSESWINKSFKTQNYIVLPSEKLTGRIYYSCVIENNKLHMKELFILSKKLTSSLIQFSLISEDLINFSFQKYSAKMKTKFAGDVYVLNFNFLIEFKDGKVKLSCKDFMVERNITKSLSNVAKTISFDKSKQATLESMYSKDIRTDDQKDFWKPINEGILELQNSLTELIQSSSKQEKDW